MRIRLTARAGIGDVMRRAARLVFLPQRSAARAVVLLAAMAGLFAMHGLAEHGAEHWAEHWGDHASPDAAMGLVAHGELHEPVAAAAPSSSMVAAAAAGILGTGDGHPPADTGSMGLCLAVLALVGLLGARLMRTRGRVRDPLRTLLRQLAAPPATLGGVDPPDRHRLHVHRC